MARYFQRERSLPQSTYAPINLGAVNQFLTEKQKGVDQLMGAADEIKDQQLEYEAIKQYEGLGQDAKDYAVVKGAADEWYAEKEKALNFLTNDLNLDNLGDATRSIAKLKNKKYNMESGIFKVASENLQLYNKAKNDLMQNARTEGIGDYEQSVLLRELEQQYVNKGELKGNSGDFNTFGSYNPYAFTNTGKFVMDVGKTEIDKEGITKIYQTTIGGAPYIRKDHSTTEERSPEEIALIGFTSMTGNRKENASLESQIEIKGKAIFDKTYYDLIKSGVNKDEARIEANKKRQEVVDFENEARNPENYGAITKEGFSFDNLSKDGFNNKYAGTIYGNALNQSIIHNAVKKTDLDSTIQEKLDYNYKGGGGSYPKSDASSTTIKTDEVEFDRESAFTDYSNKKNIYDELVKGYAANATNKDYLLNLKRAYDSYRDVENTMKKDYTVNGVDLIEDQKKKLISTINANTDKIDATDKNKALEISNKLPEYIMRYGAEKGMNMVKEEIDSLQSMSSLGGISKFIGRQLLGPFGLPTNLLISGNDILNNEGSDDVIESGINTLKEAEKGNKETLYGIISYGEGENNKIEIAQKFAQNIAKNSGYKTLTGKDIKPEDTDIYSIPAGIGNDNAIRTIEYVDENGEKRRKQEQVKFNGSKEEWYRNKRIIGSSLVYDFIDDLENTGEAGEGADGVQERLLNGSKYLFDSYYKQNANKMLTASRGTKIDLVNSVGSAYRVEAMGDGKFKLVGYTPEGTEVKYDREYNSNDIAVMTTAYDKKVINDLKSNPSR